MAYSYVWPVTLPQKPLAPGYGETIGLNVLSSPMDAGPAKRRRLSARPDTMNLTWHMTGAQVEALRTFVVSTIKGAARFGFPHPRTGATVEARIVPQQDGKFFDVGKVRPALWSVSMDFEILP